MYGPSPSKIPVTEDEQRACILKPNQPLLIADSLKSANFKSFGMLEENLAN